MWEATNSPCVKFASTTIGEKMAGSLRERHGKQKVLNKCLSSISVTHREGEGRRRPSLRRAPFLYPFLQVLLL